MNAPATQQMNFTIQLRVNKDCNVSATFSLFVEDERDAEEAGERSARLFNAFTAGYGTSV